jgi:serine/threonine-protein kinase
MTTRSNKNRKSGKARPASKKDSWLEGGFAPPASSVSVGDVLDGRWKITKKLGEGGMGSVWAAQHIVNGRKAAIKIMLPSVASDPFMRELFEREGLLSNEIDEAAKMPLQTGPGAVKVFDNGTLVDGSPYMVMEMLKGDDLGHLAQKGMLTGIDVLHAMDAVLHTLEGAHKLGIVHRDLKPDNIYVTDLGDVKVLDQGLASKVGKRDFNAGSRLGTPGYMPPEQIQGGARYAGPEADIYSVGATAYSLLSGQTPTSAKSAMEGIVECPVPPLRTVAPYVPEHIAAMVDKALACNPKDRYRTATAMRKDLEHAMIEWELRG